MQEYLQLLQERNRLKKKLSEKSSAQKAMEERERGFVTHFSGANTSKAPKAHTASSSPQTPILAAGSTKEKTPSSKPKKKWDNPGDTDQGSAKPVYFGVVIAPKENKLYEYEQEVIFFCLFLSEVIRYCRRSNRMRNSHLETTIHSNTMMTLRK